MSVDKCEYCDKMPAGHVYRRRLVGASSGLLAAVVVVLAVALGGYTQTDAPNDGQIVYYKQTAVISKDEKRSAGDNTGQFIRFTHAGCYDSDRKGFDVGNGFLKYRQFDGGIHVYYGRSYWGESTNYYFAADFSKLNVRTSGGVTYVYEKASAPAGATTSAKIYKPPPPPPPPPPPVVGPGPPPVQPFEPLQPIKGIQPSPPTKTKCYSCTGGNCRSCNGNRLCTAPGCIYGYQKCSVYSCSYGWTSSGRCGACNGQGKTMCPSCRGSGNCQTCKGSGKCSGCGGKGYY